MPLPIKTNQTYFQKMLFRIITIVSLALLILSCALYFSFRSLTLDYIYKTNLNMLGQIDNNISQINNYAKTFSASLFNNASCQQLMYSKNPDIADTLESIHTLSGLSRSTPFVQSIELYNGNTGSIYYIAPSPNVSLIRSKGNPYDTALLGLIANKKNTMMDPVSRTIPISPYSDEKADVLSYIITEQSGTGDVQNALAVNVNINWIFNSVKTGVPKNEGTLYLLDSSGKVKASSIPKYFLTDMSKQSAVSNLYNNENSSGSYIAYQDGAQSLVCYMKSQTSDWILVNILPYAYIADSVSRIQTLTAFISILAILLGALVSMFISKSLYSPVRALLDKSRTLVFPVQTRISQDEFDFISNTISSASERIKSLQSFENKNESTIRQDLLRSFLSTRSTDLEDIGGKLGNIQLDISTHSDTLLVLIKIDYYNAFQKINNEYEQFSIKLELSSIVKEILSHRFKCETVDMGNDHIVAFLELIDNTTGVFAEAEPLLRESVSAIFMHFNIGLSVFVGDSCRSIGSLPAYYKQLLDISHYRIIYGHRCIVRQQDVEKNEYEYFDTSSLNLQVLLDALSLCNLEKLKASYESIETKLVKCRYNDIEMAISFITSMIFNTISLIEKNSGFILEESYSSFKSYIDTLETMHEIKEAFFNLFAKVTKQISQFRSKKCSLIIEKIIDYIGLNYLSESISLNSIAEMYNLTPAYLNKLFRETMSASVSDYITDLKLKKAISLLSESDIVVDEIIRFIGWGNKNYFYTVFKKTTGATPSEYRIKIRNLPDSSSKQIN